jgi:sulfur carrier protein
MTVRDAIRKKNYVFPLLVVRIDGRLVSREAYDSARIPDGARVDIIHLISGG